MVNFPEQLQGWGAGMEAQQVLALGIQEGGLLSEGLGGGFSASPSCKGLGGAAGPEPNIWQTPILSAAVAARELMRRSRWGRGAAGGVRG